MIKLTEEQIRIVNKAKEGGFFKINAYAGTGKTTTLKAIVESMTDKRFLILTFSKSIAEELKRKMPSNTSIFTLHSLAYKFIVKNSKKYKLIDRKTFLDILLNNYEYDFYKALTLRDIFEKFCNSYYTEINESVIEKIIYSDKELKAKVYVSYNSFGRAGLKTAIKHISSQLKDIFEHMQKDTIGITHSFYLKKFQIELYSFSKFFKKYDYILVDEGQDLNPIQAYILQKLNIPNKIIVGDKHQSIYSWRGAINTLAKLNWEELSLTTSFRFANDDIVKLANKFLSNLKGDKNKIKAVDTGRRNGKTAFIARTNASLVREIVRLNTTFNLTRSLDEIFRPIREANYMLDFVLYDDRTNLVKLPSYIQEFLERVISEGCRTATDLASYLFEIGEIEYAQAVRIADEIDVNSVYEKAKKLLNPNSDYILVTAHSSKGLEFDTCIYADDFPDLEDYIAKSFAERGITKLEDIKQSIKAIQNNDERFSDILDEMNLQYVAITRAIKDIQGTGLNIIKNNFEKNLLELTKEIEEKIKIYKR